MNIQTLDKYIADFKVRKNSLENLLSEYGVTFESNKATVFNTECSSLKNLKVAAIMDEFTFGNFESECILLNISATNWQEELEEFKPDLFFLESAWGGKDNSWYRKIANGSKELYDLTSYCRANNIPIIFWNKEDPIYTDTFMSAAACADFIFTTDFDCIERYKRTLQHNNVYLLHFSAQPRVHNPIEIHDRKDMFCFAGAYYHRYKDRSKVFDTFAEKFKKGKGLEIYDRNLGSARPEHAFPTRYNKMIVGTLSPDDIHIAYKGYNYGINMNSASQSQTMFARRVYELLASNTVSVGNYSRGVKNLFGDLTVATNNVNTMMQHLNTYCKTDDSYRKYRLLGLRKVLQSHLCEDRLGFVASCVFGKDMKQALPNITIVSYAKTNKDKQKVTASFNRQTYHKKTLVFINSKNSKIEPTDFIAAFSPDDYYGSNYLTDLALSVRYSNADGFGKNNYYKKINENFELNGKESTYKPCRATYSTRCIVKSDLIDDIQSFAKGQKINGNFLCIDEFNYCKDCNDNICPIADDVFIADQGISLEVINNAATKIEYQDIDNDDIIITPEQLTDSSIINSKSVQIKLVNGKFSITSSLPDDCHEYINFNTTIKVSDVTDKKSISVLFSGMGTLNTESFCFQLDSSMNKICHCSTSVNRFININLDDKTVYLSFSIRIKGSGSKELSSISVGENATSGNSAFPTRSDTIVVADYYPADEDLYRYMFVHKRNILYKESGLVPDMMCINPWNEDCYREFEGINVSEGSEQKLTAALDSGSVKTVCVHFMNPYLWSILKNYLDNINIIIWNHGSDIQQWHRRSYIYNTKAEIEEAKKASAEKVVFWNEIFKYSEIHNIHFVFVSEFFRKQIEEDYNVDLSARSSIIHNCIDSDMFSYKEKTPAHRFNILSVKSFHTLTYANDITQQAIILLSKEPEFQKMVFNIYGDGDRFEEDTHLLKKFKNVHLHKQFLLQKDIAKLHKTHGIYIATTRMDTQGVSRDEAMASGLVPVATNVAAVPEFTDDSCCILVPEEDPQAVADAILKLVRNPDLFMQMSKNAAEHVRGISSKELTIKKELNLIEKRKNYD